MLQLFEIQLLENQKEKWIVLFKKVSIFLLRPPAVEFQKVATKRGNRSKMALVEMMVRKYFLWKSFFGKLATYSNKVHLSKIFLLNFWELF